MRNQLRTEILELDYAFRTGQSATDFEPSITAIQGAATGTSTLKPWNDAYGLTTASSYQLLSIAHSSALFCP